MNKKRLQRLGVHGSSHGTHDSKFPKSSES